MFRKLRLRLTLVNVAIILFLFLLLIAGAYFFAKIDMSRHDHFVAAKIIADIQSGRITDIPFHGFSPTEPTGPPPIPMGPPPIPMLDQPPGPPHAPPGFKDFFFVKLSPSGQIIFKSTSQPFSGNHLAELTNNVLSTRQTEGTIVFNDIKYSFHTSSVNSKNSKIILFHDVSKETDLLRSLLTSLLVVGIVCSLLSFGASFFLAHKAMVPIKKAWQQQKDFLSDASHELRTPLTVIQTNLEVVLSNPDETVASQAKWLNYIAEEASCMTKLVDSLLFLARADSNQQILDKQFFLLNESVNRAIAPFEAIAAAKDINLEAVIKSEIYYYGDESRIKQVIHILLDNALRHTPVGGSISVSLLQKDSKPLLLVTDTGEGIAPEQLPNIFNRFYQVDKSRNRGGAGLGLAIAKWIIENHNGTISASSTLGKGTIFTIALPQSLPTVD